MGKYTQLGSADLDEHIDADMRRIAEVTAPHVQAGILLGGYGRGEGTPFINADGSQSPFNDYDLIVIVEQLKPETTETLQQLEQQLTEELNLTVDLFPYRLSGLPRCEFSLLNYEMKYGHKVIWGNENILETLPAYSHKRLPLSEGTRLLLNRGKLLLDIKHRLERSKPLSDEERICFIKFLFKVHLALGDCALLDARNYDISYAVKNERIHDIGHVPHRDYIIHGFRRAVELKAWGDFIPLEEYDVVAEFKIMRAVFLEFFPWYREKHHDDEELVFKSITKNLLWHGRPLPRHPRSRLYDALPELLGHYPDEHFLRKILFCHDNFADTFYKLQRRFA